MRALKYLAIVLGSIFLFAGCQKEYSFETGLTGSLASGSLQSAQGDCQPIVVNGEYIQDTVLTDSNSVTVQVNISSPGVYRITTDTVNGFYFKDSGFVSTTGLQSFTLKAEGTPILEQATTFAVTFDSTFCFFQVDVTAQALPDAVYTLGGAPTTCTNAAIQGTYTQGTALNITNTVAIQVNVTTPGRYLISTTATNGMTFTGQGAFATTGLMNVTLQGSGTPTTAGVNTVPITAGGTSCSFTINVIAGTDPVDDVNSSDSAWQFTQGTNFYHGYIAGAEIGDTLGQKVLNIVGITPATEDTALLLVVNLGTTVTPGTYTTVAQAGFYLVNVEGMDTTLNYIYSADPTTTGIVTSIVITSYNATTGIIQGTFSGNAKNKQGSSVPITAGKFTAKLD